MNELDLFAAAIAITDPDERAALLVRECAGRPEVRNRLDQLLHAHFKYNPLLDPVGPEQTAASDGSGPTTESVCIATEAEGTVIAGRFKLLQQIGEGGMGSVWMADQTEPVKRRVAVKLIRIERGNSRTILSRFEAERQAIALMDHPHIAKLLDAGTTAEGSPFFVMELVKGIPLNEYCDTHKLNIRDRLQLFTQICSAVQHAHQKGIIHRDLKPTNILVESHDGKPVPKVIDFGLAKATSGIQLSEHTLFTAFGSVMGTPLYMAPEQATFNAVDIDTRADVYALGVILYELLTGTTPITRESLKKAAVDEMLRLIREQEAPTPSSRLSTRESTPSIAANRQMEPRKLGRFIKGELDWIVMKALSKERDRRYETANGFARDVERFLTNEPVAAGPPSASYRLRKFVRRNRPQVIAASLVLFALLAGFAGTAFGLMRARQQQRIAETAALAERQAKQDADAKRAEAETQQRRAEAGEKLAGERLVQVEAEKKRTEEEKQIAVAVKDFLQNKLLGQADVSKQANALLAAGSLATAAKHDRTILELLNQAAQELSEAKIESNFPNQPILQAEILDTVGTTYQGAGEPGRAIEFLQRSLALCKAKLGIDHPDTLNTMNNLALAYYKAAKLDLAVPLHEETLKLTKAKLGPGHPMTLTSMNYLAGAYLRAGKLDLAVPLNEETLKLRKAKLGPDHPDTLTSMNDLAFAYDLAGKLDLAMPLLEETLRLKKIKLGPDHPDTLTSVGNLAVAYNEAGKLDLAVPLLEETLKLMKAKLGPDHPNTITSMNNLALAYANAGKLNLAVPLHEDALRLTKAKLGPDHPDTLTSMNNLAATFWKAKQLDRSVPLLEEALKRKEAKLGRDHPETLMTVANLGVNYKDAGRYKEAIPLLEEAHRAAKKYRTLSWVGTPLLDAYTKAGEQSKTADLLGDQMSEARKTLPQESPQLAAQLANLGLSLLQAKAFTEAERLMRECLAIRERKEPDDWRTFNTQSVLGGALLGQKKFAEAEPLLLKGYEGMKQRQKSIPPQANTRIPEALDRLIDLYTATNRPDEVKKWRAERAKYPEAALVEKK
jgi:serine/threonine protein kinase/tetratricopeptide (TPR) repeat protein